MLPPNRIWRTYPGGKILDSIEGKFKGEDNHFPEDWIASTTLAVNKGREEFTEEGLSHIKIDDLNLSLKTLTEKFSGEILGQKHYKKYGANTQFLLKFLDSAIRLHIQAHPTIPFAQKYLNSNSGKTEAYIILSIRDDIRSPYIYLGFQHSVTEEEFKQVIVEQDTNKMLSFFNKIHIKPGDVFIVPGGLPHAIGEGVFMIEIMEPTDFVVRLEFERGGYLLPEEARFMGKDINFALNMINFTPISTEKIRQKYFSNPRLIYDKPGGKEFILIDKKQTPCFSVNKLYLNGSYNKNSDSFYVGIVIKGTGKISSGSFDKDIKRGDKYLIPFQTKNVEYFTEKGMEIIFAFPPQ